MRLKKIGVQLSITIFAQNFLPLRSSRDLFDLRANFSAIAIFDCGLRAILQSVRRAIFDCDLRENFSLDAPRSDAGSFGVSFAFGSCLFRSFYFGRCGNGRGSLGRRLFRKLLTLFLLDCLRAFGLFMLSLSVYAVSFGRSTRFQTVYSVSFGFSYCSDAVAYLGRGYFGHCLFRMLLPRFFRTLSLLDAVFFGRECSSLDAAALLRTRMLLFLQTRMLFLGCFCYSSDADTFLGRGCFLGGGFLRGSVDNIYPCTMIYVSSYIE